MTCSAEGHEDASADVTVGPGGAQAVKLTLKPGASRPAGADPKSGVTLIALPGGTLQLDRGNFNGAQVAPFKLARTATTVAQYKKCVEARACPRPEAREWAASSFTPAPGFAVAQAFELLIPEALDAAALEPRGGSRAGLCSTRSSPQAGSRVIGAGRCFRLGSSMIFARSAACLVLCVSLLSSTAALAMDKTIVVLPIDIARAGGKMSVDARISVEEMIRDEAVDALAGTGWTVLSGETTLKKLKDNGIDPTQCDDQGCHLETAQNMTVPMFISGSVQYVEGTFTASIRLIESATGKQLAATHFESTRVLGLRAEFSKAAPEFFRKAGLAADDDGATNAPATTNPGRVVEFGNPPRPGPAAQGTIKVVSKPSGAKVSVDGDAAGSTPLTIKRDAGTYVVTVELPGYAPASRQVDVASGKTALVNESLMQAAGYLEIGVSPDGAARAANVTVDGQPAGVGKQGPYKVGKHAVRVEASGYQAAEQAVGVDNGGTASVSLGLEALPGKLLLSVNVAAQCSAGGARVEATPDGMVKLEVPAGAARVTCSAEGHEDASADVTVGPGRAQAVKLTLQRGASWAAGVDAKSGVAFIALPGGTLQLSGGNFNGTRVAPFKLARTATTVAQYKKCVEAGGCGEPTPGDICNWGSGRSAPTQTRQLSQHHRASALVAAQSTKEGRNDGVRH